MIIVKERLVFIYLSKHLKSLLNDNNDDNDDISVKLYHLLAEFMGLGLFSSIRPAAIM
jgi:hypothetical protein